MENPDGKRTFAGRCCQGARNRTRFLDPNAAESTRRLDARDRIGTGKDLNIARDIGLWKAEHRQDSRGVAGRERHVGTAVAGSSVSCPAWY